MVHRMSDFVEELRRDVTRLEREAAHFEAQRMTDLVAKIREFIAEARQVIASFERRNA